jgi:hypothetical protein
MNYIDITNLVKEAKKLLARAERYEDAKVARELEAILDTDGSKLRERSLVAICQIINELCKPKQK